jgi:hypothetical protein
MSREFFKFPRTPHLWWPLDRAPNDDRVLDAASAAALLSGDVVVEEKIDGANVGLSLDPNGGIRAQNRGSWIERGTHSQFQPLWSWISRRQFDLAQALNDDVILFGEWCFAVHSVRYDRLPDWFLGFDVYDRATGRFWSVPRRDAFLRRVGVSAVPRLFEGRTTLSRLQSMLHTQKSRVGSGPLEGLYIRRDGTEWLEGRAKLVRPEFLLSIEKHWSSRSLEHNIAMVPE